MENDIDKSEQNPSEPPFEDKASECEAKFRVLFDNVSSGVAIYAAKNDAEDFVFVDFNRAAEEIDRVRKEDVIGKSVLKVFPGVKDFGLFAVLQRVWRTGTPEHHPVSTYKDNRITGWRENYVYRLPSGEIVAVYDDVTQSKRSELAQRMSEQCFRAIADYTYDWEVWVSPGGRPLWTNPAGQRVTGYTIKELTTMRDYPIPVVYKEDQQKMRKAFRSALRGSSGNDVEFRIERKDGGVVWVEMSWQPIYDENNMSLGHRESVRDIAARKKAEQALEQAERQRTTILDSLAERVLYLDTEMKILWANRVAHESVGMSRAELIGRRCYDVWSDGKGPCTGCPVVRAISTGRTQEGERETRDGRVWFLQGSPVRSDAGDIVGAVEIALDITQRKRIEEALRESEAKYKRLVDDSRDG
jgi:PAS domain S-box-containing protein